MERQIGDTEASVFVELAGSGGMLEQYVEVVREVESSRKQLAEMDLVARSAGEVARAGLIARVEKMKKEIEEANEEHVLVELARIEAEKERQDIEAQRAEAAGEFAGKLLAKRKKIEALKRELVRATEMERKLAATNADVAVLQGEMEMVRAMQRSGCRPETATEESNGGKPYSSKKKELEAAKRELAAIKAEGFQFMATMDQTRRQLMAVAGEVERLRKLESKKDSAVKNLNLKLQKAQSRLQSAAQAEERSAAIVSNLVSALQQLRTEIKAMRGEKERIDGETRAAMAGAERARAKMASREAEMSSLIQQLHAAKAAEAEATERLRIVAEKTMKARCSGKSTVTVSKFEYDYLTQSAKLARALADRKVAAAMAWVEALKATQKLIEANTEMLKNKKSEDKMAVTEDSSSSAAKRKMEDELKEWKETESLLCEIPARKSVRDSTGSRRMSRVSMTSAGARNPRSPSFALKRKKTLVPNLVKILRGKRSAKHK